MQKILNELKMNIKQFSEHYEIPYNTVRQWVNGTRQPPSYIIKLINEEIEREKKGEQLNFTDLIDDKFIRYEKILKQYDTVTPKMIIWNNEKLIEVTKYENKIIIEYGTAFKTTTNELKEEKELIQVINKIFK